MITHVTKGVCPVKAREEKDCFYVSWIENGETKTKYFPIVMMMYNFYNKIKHETNF